MYTVNTWNPGKILQTFSESSEASGLMWKSKSHLSI